MTHCDDVICFHWSSHFVTRRYESFSALRNDYVMITSYFMSHFDDVKYFYLALHIVLGQYESFFALRNNDVMIT